MTVARPVRGTDPSRAAAGRGGRAARRSQGTGGQRQGHHHAGAEPRAIDSLAGADVEGVAGAGADLRMTDPPAVRPWKTGRPELGSPGLGGPGPEGPGPGPSGQEARLPAQAAGPQPPDPRECPLAGPRAAQPSLE